MINFIYHTENDITPEEPWGDFQLIELSEEEAIVLISEQHSHQVQKAQKIVSSLKINLEDLKKLKKSQYSNMLYDLYCLRHDNGEGTEVLIFSKEKCPYNTFKREMETTCIASNLTYNDKKKRTIVGLLV